MKDKKVSEGSRQDDFFNICGNCGIVCCKGAKPPLTRKRISILESYLLKEGIIVEKPFMREGYSFPRETSSGCVFLDAAKRCRIQPLKPETCVAGPVTFDINISKGIIEWYLKTEKICPLAGTLFRNKDKLQRHLESAKREIASLIRGLTRKELLAILSIEEPETFKIGEDPLDPKVLAKLR